MDDSRAFRPSNEAVNSEPDQLAIANRNACTILSGRIVDRSAQQLWHASQPWVPLLFPGQQRKRAGEILLARRVDIESFQG